MKTHTSLAVLGLTTLTSLGGDPTTTEKLAGPPRAAETLTFGDYDGDGRPDAVALSAHGVRLLHNAGAGAFDERTHEAGLAELVGPVAAAWGDWDGDGRLDLFLAGAPGASRLFLQGGPGTFLELADDASPWSARSVTGAECVDLDGDALADLHLETATGDLVLHAIGGGVFETVETGRAEPVLGSITGVPGRATPEGEGGIGTSSGASGPSALEPSYDPTAAAFGAAAGACVAGVLDQAIGVCLPASSVPTLGMLYPMTSDLFVSLSGNVGVGTLTPGARLDVVGDLRASGQLVSTTPTGAPLSVSSSTRVDGLNADLLDGLSSSAFSQFGSAVESAEVTDGTLTNADVSSAAAIAGTKVAPNFGSQDVVTGGYVDVGYGSTSNPTYRFSPSEATGLSSPIVETLSLLTSGAERVRVAADGDVGVGTASPTGRLHVLQSNAFAPAVYGAHTNSGYGVWAESNGALEALAVTQNGTGDIISGYSSGSLKFRVRNNGNVQVKTLTITGGSDLVEGFPASEDCPPGTVVVADRRAPGSVAPSERAYDGAVLGIVSGAGGVSHGVHLSQEGVLEGEIAVALTGRVFARCTAAGGPIHPGDLLTTSDVAGHAMRATERDRWSGAIVGKALGSLDEGSGLVLVLVNLH